MDIANRIGVKSMILIVIIELIIDKNRARDRISDIDSDSTSHLILTTNSIISDSILYDIVREINHRDTYTNKYGRHYEK